MTSNFKQQLKELDTLARDAKASLFRRAQIIVSLIKNQEFWSYLQTRDLHSVCDYLGRYIADTKFSTDDLSVMVEFAPDESQWNAGNVSKLCSDAWDAKAAKNPARTPRVAAADTPPMPESRGSVESQLDRLRSEVDRLTSENAALKQENRELKKRLRSVEKCLA